VKDQNKVIVLFIIDGIVLWIIDALIDSLFFSEETFFKGTEL